MFFFVFLMFFNCFLCFAIEGSHYKKFCKRSFVITITRDTLCKVLRQSLIIDFWVYPEPLRYARLKMKKTKTLSNKSISPFKALISVKIKHFEILFGLADVSFKYLIIHFAENFSKGFFVSKTRKNTFLTNFSSRFQHKTYHNSKWAELEKFSEKT